MSVHAHDCNNKSVAVGVRAILQIGPMENTHRFPTDLLPNDSVIFAQYHG